MNDRYRTMSDEEAKQAIRNCITDALLAAGDGAPVKNVFDAVNQLGVNGIVIEFHPSALDGKVHFVGSLPPSFEFTSYGPQGHIIHG